MALPPDQRFPVAFGEAFTLDPVLVGEIRPETEFHLDRPKPAHEWIDELTRLRL